jgi:thiol-disulfide isomerase/thioredoxin
MKSTSRKTLISIFIVSIVALAIIAYLYPRYEGFSNGADATITLVYADWCPHCKTIKPAMEAVAKSSPIEVKGKKVAFQMFEEKKDATQIAQFPKVEGYPTFFYSIGGAAPEEYRGPRDIDAIKEFITSKL